MLFVSSDKKKGEEPHIRVEKDMSEKEQRQETMGTRVAKKFPGAVFECHHPSYIGESVHPTDIPFCLFLFFFLHEAIM